jgi:hypothetical protein
MVITGTHYSEWLSKHGRYVQTHSANKLETPPVCNIIILEGFIFYLWKYVVADTVDSKTSVPQSSKINKT